MRRAPRVHPATRLEFSLVRRVRRLADAPPVPTASTGDASRDNREHGDEHQSPKQPKQPSESQNEKQDTSPDDHQVHRGSPIARVQQRTAGHHHHGDRGPTPAVTWLRLGIEHPHVCSLAAPVSTRRRARAPPVSPSSSCAGSCPSSLCPSARKRRVAARSDETLPRKSAGVATAGHSLGGRNIRGIPIAARARHPSRHRAELVHRQGTEVPGWDMRGASSSLTSP